MPRYRIDVAYNGTDFSGWQVQPNAPTIQQEIERALKILAAKPVTVHGSGRTDAGVHARRQTAHFDLEAEIDCTKWLRSMNGLLPASVVLRAIKPVNHDFHARFDAEYRLYHYYFSDRHQPLHAETTAVWVQSFDCGPMQKAASYIRGDLDCRTFTPFDHELPHHRCLFYDAGITGPDEDERYCFYIKANRFLRSVVRSIMGTLIDVGQGKRSPESFEQLFLQPDRHQAGTTAPAKGLVLQEVGYPNT